MLKLDRTSVDAPPCLADYNHPTHEWSDFRGTCKKQLRFALVQLQGIDGVTTEDAAEYGVRCAYCEGAIFHEGHIEHFRRKNPDHFPELTFSWSNLFLACGSIQHCGHHKDRRSAPDYDPSLLIKPDEHDPEHYLYFHSSGKVLARNNLSDHENSCATETIRVFGLDNPALEGARVNAVRSYRKMHDADLSEIASWSDAERDAYFRGEIEATRWLPYATTIRHFLQK
ncbi:retron system putative HNH endonuclease [Pseudomonas syringae]|uniref:retron system putative HNH endonuclease n=1 Tax=Pseudomonas syringae TaxID=317 RepID=UPI0003475B2A|nr:retron system putative HNH endonuclease [Pseudomonas syringae]